MNEKNLLTALGPIAPLYEDTSITEIMVDAPDKVYVERNGQMEDVDIQFAADTKLRQMIDSVLALADVQLSPQKTTAEIRLPNGSLLVAVIPPTAVHSPNLVIRKWPSHLLTWEMLFEFGSVTEEIRDLLQSAITNHKNILIAGSTNSGKTTIANRVIELIPETERVVIAEKIYEMHTCHPRTVALEMGNTTNMTIEHLLNTAVRMRPDWLVVGELFGPEAMLALQLFNAGNAGIATIHANNPEDALARLETMCLMANLGLGLLDIRALIASAIQMISFQEQLPDRSRKITQVVEIAGLDKERYILQPLFRYNPKTAVVKPTGAKPSWA